ncbi:MAG: efflux RND transporter periplasmic adaptor subunit [Spirosoma sp.]|nr:efflux RND transporter periplasmic adaptor subunit [Spirosoma sp.]
MNRFIIHSLLCLGMLAGCQQKPAPTEPATAPFDSTTVELTATQLRLGGVTIGRVSYRPLSAVITVNGRLAVPAGSQVSITALQGGFVRSLPLLAGQSVQKGQVLARIENLELIQLQQDYAETWGRLTYVETEYARQRELSAQNASALKVFQQTTADRTAAQARLRGLAQRLRLVGIDPATALDGSFTATYLVRAPLAGVITGVLANRGQFVQPADVIAQLTSNEGLYAELTVFENDLPRIRVDQPVRLRLTTAADAERLGRISLINRAFEPDRSVRVVVRLDRPGPHLLPNTFLTARIDLGTRRVTALPDEALVRADGRQYIFLALADSGPARAASDSDTTTTRAFRAVSVRAGVSENGYSQVMLPDSFSIDRQRVVVKGAYALWSQLKGGGADD